MADVSVKDVNITVTPVPTTTISVVNSSQSVESTNNSTVKSTVSVANPTQVVTMTGGIPGPKGEPGDTGPAGVGVPVGGTTGQVLSKTSGTDYDTEWVDQSGGSGAVDSVNTQTGAVVLDADDIDDTATTNKFVTAADVTKLGNLSGTNTGDQDLSGYALATDIPTDNASLTNGAGYITSYTETDPVYSASEAANITATDITNLGNLSGTNTGDQTNITGNAATATALETARNIGSVSFDGTTDIIPEKLGDVTNGLIDASYDANFSPSVIRLVAPDPLPDYGDQMNITAPGDLFINSNTSADGSGTWIPEINMRAGNIELHPSDVGQVIVQGNEFLLGDATLSAASVTAIHTLSLPNKDGTFAMTDDIPTVPSSIDDLSDVDTSTTAPTDTQVLAWNDTDSKWEPADAASGGTGGANLAATLSATQTVITSDTGTDATIPAVDGTNAGVMTPTMKGKLDGIASGAEVNTVDSVNTQTGAVVLDADDISDTSTTNKFVTSADITKLGNLSGTNTGDQTSVTGNAGTATKLVTARTIAGVSFDGSANINIGIDGLSDVDTSTTAPTDTQVLAYNGTSSKWEPADAGSGGSGDVVGPSSATNNALATFDGTTGKLIQDSGVPIVSVATTTGTQTLTEKTLKAPVLTDGSGNVFGTFTVPGMGQSQITADSSNTLVLASGSGSTEALRIAEATDNTKLISVTLSGATTGTKTTITAAQTANRTLTLPDATGTVALTSSNITGSAATLTTGRTFRTNLASTSTATFNGSANVTPGVTGTLPVANGGTGTTTSTGTGSVVLGTSPTLTTPTITQSAWTTPTFTNSWTNLGSGFASVAYMKDSMGFVHVTGIASGGTIGTSAFTLPAGYRPLATHDMMCASNNAVGIVQVASTGTVTPSFGSNAWVSMEFTFLAEA